MGVLWDTFSSISTIFFIKPTHSADRLFPSAQQRDQQEPREGLERSHAGGEEGVRGNVHDRQASVHKGGFILTVVWCLLMNNPSKAAVLTPHSSLCTEIIVKSINQSNQPIKSINQSKQSTNQINQSNQSTNQINPLFILIASLRK